MKKELKTKYLKKVKSVPSCAITPKANDKTACSPCGC